jgi:hypothetical protein
MGLCTFGPNWRPQMKNRTPDFIRKKRTYPQKKRKYPRKKMQKSEKIRQFTNDGFCVAKSLSRSLHCQFTNSIL